MLEMSSILSVGERSCALWFSQFTASRGFFALGSEWHSGHFCMLAGLLGPYQNLFLGHATWLADPNGSANQVA